MSRVKGIVRGAVIFVIGAWLGAVAVLSVAFLVELFTDYGVGGVLALIGGLFVISVVVMGVVRLLDWAFDW